MFNKPEDKKKKKKTTRETFPWTLSHDMKETGDSLNQAETITKRKLSMEGVKNGGMDMIFKYDNERAVFERDTPQGNKWYNTKTLKNHGL